MSTASLDALARGFRHGTLGYDELSAQLHAWAEAFPSLVDLRSLGRTPQGRELWLLQIGPEPERERPTAWVDANLHASELAGSSVALAIAEDAIRLHLDPSAALHDLPPHLREVIAETRLMVMPRISPDGAEEVLKTGRWIRSVPRDERPHQPTRWRCHDLDGDGLSLLMRRPDPTGEYVESSEIPGLMLRRELDDPGPYYKIWPEGSIEGFDGQTVPTPTMTGDNSPDLNRNFPYDWAPEHVQAGSGPFALSEPESRALVDFVARHPTIFAWLDLHTYGGVFIRPLGTAPDNTMDRGDLAIWHEIEAFTERLTGYPMVSGFAEFTYEPNTPLHGDLSEFAYHSRGALAYVCELWDLFRQLDMPRPARFVDHYTLFDREMLHRLARWDAEHNRSRIFRPWVPVRHPQLGSVEVGGMDFRFGVRNPPPERLGELCRRHAAAFLRVMAMAPRPWVSIPLVGRVGADLWEVELRVENHGYLATHVVPSSRHHDWNEPLRAELSLEGPTLLDETDGQRALGHLEGWGRGRQTWFGSPGFFRSSGSVSSRRLRWVLRGSGRVVVRVGSCRVGWQQRELELA
ncbi:MAG: peptidase M14 [Myxococcales bacterium]|nr:peptidase M14 [Myxococcales bacterium]MCB9715269.1 peptidase M14 [Myxococcales bacterium]